MLSIFPGSEPLRYTIPFQQPQATIDYLRGIAEQRAGAVVVFGDDGEKFGTWPETKKHVYDHGWLRQFFDALAANRDWLHVTTLAEAIDNVPPGGQDLSARRIYREMTEWALPVDSADRIRPRRPRAGARPALAADQAVLPRRLLAELQGEVSRGERDVRPDDDGQPAAGERAEYGTRHRPADQQRISLQLRPPGAVPRPVQLPLLARGVRRHLSAAPAERDLQPAHRLRQPARPGDRQDAAASSRRPSTTTTSTPGRKCGWPATSSICLLAPASGGMLYELDVRSICHNLLATLARRPEAYHRKVLAGASGGNGQVASIHDRVVFKQAGLDQRLQYDR